MTMTIPSTTITDLVEGALDDCGALADAQRAFAIATVLERLTLAAKCRAAGIGHRLGGSINLASDEERLSELHLVSAAAIETRKNLQ